MAAPALTWTEIGRRRLQGQHLDTPVPAASFLGMVGGGPPAGRPHVGSPPRLGLGGGAQAGGFPGPAVLRPERRGGLVVGGLVVDVEPFAPVEPILAELAAEEARRLATFLGIFGDITVGGFVAGRGRKNLPRSST